MDSCAIVASTLTAAGAVAELVGLAFVVRQLRDDRRRARELLAHLEDPGRPERYYPPPQGHSAAPPSYANPAWAPSMHLRGVIEDLQRFKTEVGNALVKLKQITDEEVDTAADRIMAGVARRDEDLANGLRHVLAGSAWERWLGVGLLFGGIVLGTAGSLAGNLC